MTAQVVREQRELGGELPELSLFLAMTHARAGNAQEAQRKFESACAAIDKMENPSADATRLRKEAAATLAQ